MRPHQTQLVRRNLRLAAMKYGLALNQLGRLSLRSLTLQFGFLLELGDVLLLDGSWYVTHCGLVRLALRKRCVGIRVAPVLGFCAPEQSRWAFRATAFKSASCKGFNGYGDANPDNVSPIVRGAEMRIAETRAVNRALRKAYGIGLCSVEEVGSFNPSSEPAAAVRKTPQATKTGEHPLRDRLLVIVRKHRLDAGLVKLYAADFCGVEEIRQASREQMRQFIDYLAEQTANDVEVVRQKLTSYQKAEEGVA